MAKARTIHTCSTLALRVSGTGGRQSGRDSRKEVAEVEWNMFLARELEKVPVRNSRELVEHLHADNAPGVQEFVGPGAARVLLPDGIDEDARIEERSIVHADQIGRM